MKWKGLLSKKDKEKGVSEVLGSILVLLITVMLFSTVFYYVGTMPTPQPKIYAQFDATLHVVQNKTGGYCLNITVKNVGGESLIDWRTMFIIVIDFTAKQHMLSELHFSTQPFDKDGKFSQGESFYYNSSWDHLNWSEKNAINSLNIGITLLDKNTGSIIWSTRLQGRTNMPPVLVGLTSSPATPILGKPATFKAIVFNPNNGGDVGAYKVYLDFSQSILKYTIEDSPIKAMNYAGANAFTTTVIFKSNDTLNILRPYTVRVWINNGLSNISYPAHIYVSRGTEIKGPDLYISSSSISLSTYTPTHGDNVIVTVTIQNMGGTNATFRLKVQDEYYRYPGIDHSIYINTSKGASNSIPTGEPWHIGPGGQTTVSFMWKRVGTNSTGDTPTEHVAGTHHLKIEIVDVNPRENPNIYPDSASVEVTVLPKILLVDDDGAPSGSPGDTSRYYKYYLDTCGYSYDVASGDMDRYTLSNTLKQYDLVIWETGYNNNSLYLYQINSLNYFVENGGSLWLISQNSNAIANITILLGISTTSITHKDFTGNITGINDSNINLTLPTGNLIKDNLINRDDIKDANSTIFITTTTGVKGFIVNYTSPTSSQKVAVYKTYTSGGKLVYLGFELSRVKHYYAQDFIAYRILKWLGNLTGRAGNDLAIEDLIIKPLHPPYNVILYQEPVNITVVVSNNGGKNLSSSVLLEIDGQISVHVTPRPTAPTGNIPPYGGFVDVNFTWIPASPGEHIITAIVDPYNLIEETNKANNVLNEEVIPNKVYVHFSTLIVYNSSTVNGINNGKNTYENLTETLQVLGYKYKTLDINPTKSKPNGYYNGSYFKQFNLVIWANCSLGSKDIQALESAMGVNSNTQYFFMGTNFMRTLSNNIELREFLDLNTPQVTSSPSSYVLYGVNNQNSITNGISIIVSSPLYKLSSTNTGGSMGLFWKYAALSNQYSYLENISKIKNSSIPEVGYGLASFTPGKYVVLPFGIDEVKGIFGLKSWKNARPYDPGLQGKALLIYRLFKFFGYQDIHPELATYTSDIQIIYGGNNPNLPPIIGRSYMLRSTVYNYGSKGASVVVRFYDDYEWIGSKTTYLPPANVTTNGVVVPSSAQLEIVWTPMFAGKARHIRVIVDPLNEVKEITWNGTQYAGKEIFNFNNEAIKTVKVYYFWDNMENGAGNWIHQATILDINGESPLDFVNRKDVSTNVIGDWDWGLSGSTDSSGNFHQDENTFYSNETEVLNFTNGAHHSAPNAFWMPEAPRINKRKPIDVIFVIDTSGSMNSVVQGATVGDVNGDGKANTRIDVAIQAALDAIELLGDSDRVAIFTFNGNSHPDLALGFTYVTQQNLQTIETTLTGLRASGGTPLYDTLSWAVYYMDRYSADNPDRQDATRGILVLTDGLSNYDNYGTSRGDEYDYAPGTGLVETESGVVNEYKKYTPSGLLKVPYNLLAISIAPDAWDGRLFPIGNSSQGRISMGLFEDDPVVIQQVFTMFIQLLIQQTTGGLRATPPIGSYKNDLNLQGSLTIQGLGAVVFSDGFRNYTNYPGDANTPGFLGKWQQQDFVIASNNDGNYYYKGQSVGGDDRYWVAQTDTSGAYLQHTVYPYKVLKYHYPGTYTIKGAEIRFWVGDHGDVWWYSFYPDGSKATINIYINGQLIDTKSFDDSSGNTPEEYFTVQIPVSVYSSGGSFDFKIEISSISGTIGIDDVMVVYYIDYTPPTSNSGGGTIPSDYSSVVNTATNYTYLITPPVDVSSAKKAILAFWTKYWMTQGTNGGIMYLWGSNEANTWSWDKSYRYYIMPTQSYTGNLDPRYFDSDWARNVILKGGPIINGQQNGMADATYTGSGTKGLPMWCFNGRSASGTFGWEYIEVDLTPYLSHFKYIRIVFMLVQFGGISPSSGWNPAMGWYLDDVKITVSGDNSNDLWKLENLTWDKTRNGIGAYSGYHAWVYNDSSGNLPHGVDSSLITKQIDLTTARTAMLSFEIRFNLNPAAGVPPATVRVEVSDDNGMTWQSITYGVRIGWGASGTGGMAGTSSNGEYGWVNSGTLSRINCDLSGWAGKSIMIKFRVVTNATDYPTYANSNDPYGVFIDDVVVYGEGYALTVPVSGNYLWTSSNGLTSERMSNNPDTHLEKSKIVHHLILPPKNIDIISVHFIHTHAFYPHIQRYDFYSTFYLPYTTLRVMTVPVWRF